MLIQSTVIYLQSHVHRYTVINGNSKNQAVMGTECSGHSTVQKQRELTAQEEAGPTSHPAYVAYLAMC